MKPLYRLDHWLFCDVPRLCLIRSESSCLRFELGGKYLRPYFSANRKICATFSWLPGMSFWIARQEVWTMSHGCHATNHDSYTRPSKIPKQARNINLHILKPSYHPGPNMATNLKYEWLLKRPLICIVPKVFVVSTGLWVHVGAISVLYPWVSQSRWPDFFALSIIFFTSARPHMAVTRVPMGHESNYEKCAWFLRTSVSLN